MLKNFSCIVIRDFLILDFTGVIRKRNAVPVQRFGKLCIVGNLFALL